MRWRLALSFVFGFAAVGTGCAAHLFNKYPECVLFMLLLALLFMTVSMSFAQDDGRTAPKSASPDTNGGK